MSVADIVVLSVCCWRDYLPTSRLSAVILGLAAGSASPLFTDIPCPALRPRLDRKRAHRRYCRGGNIRYLDGRLTFISHAIAGGVRDSSLAC